MQPQYGLPVGPGLFQPPSAQSPMPVAVSLPGGGVMTDPAVVEPASIYQAPVSVYQVPQPVSVYQVPQLATSFHQLASQAPVQNEAAMQIGAGGSMAMPRYADFVLCFAYLPILGLYLFLFSEVGFGATVFKTLTQARFSIFPCSYHGAGNRGAVSCGLANRSIGGGLFPLRRQPLCFHSLGSAVLLEHPAGPVCPHLVLFFLVAMYYIAIYLTLFVHKESSEYNNITECLTSMDKAMTLGGIISLGSGYCLVQHLQFLMGTCDKGPVP